MTDIKVLKTMLDNITSGQAPLKYKDPQEFLKNMCRDESSDIYSFGMYFFRLITGSEYFEYINVPEDEYFMTSNMDDDVSVIDEDMGCYSQMLAGMTKYTRELRWSKSQVISFISALIAKEQAGRDDKTVRQSGQFTAQNGFDYGIIVNNKRTHRIMYQKMLSETYDESFTVCVVPGRSFQIAVSKRELKYDHITSPSTVRGKAITPLGILEISPGACAKISIRFCHDDSKNITFRCDGLDEKDMKQYEIPDESVRFIRV